MSKHLPTTPTITSPAPDSPHVLSMGAGVDSVAIVVGCVRAGLPLDLIIFSDTGAEKPETYLMLDILDSWLESVGYPKVTRVRYETETARYSNLEGNCLHNDTLPSLAMSGHSCSIKWKIDAIDAHLKTWEPGIEAIKAGKQIVRMVGYDAGCADGKRFVKAEKLDAMAENSPFAMWYPLRDWGWARERCQAEIAAEPELTELCEAFLDQPHPFKSACYFCPASGADEVTWLAETHPDLALKAAVMELRAATGKHGLQTVQGLGLTGADTPKAPKGERNWNWGAYLVEKGLLPADWKALAIEKGYLPADWDTYSVSCAPYRERVLAAKAAEETAYDVLPDTLKTELEAARKAKKLASYAKALEGLPYPALQAWLAACAEHKAARQAKEALLSPDWAAQPLKVKDKAKAKAKRATNKAWKVLVAA